MGAKPSPVANAGGGQVNPWKTGNLTQQMLLSEQDPTACSSAQARGSKIVSFCETNPLVCD